MTVLTQVSRTSTSHGLFERIRNFSSLLELRTFVVEWTVIIWKRCNAHDWFQTLFFFAKFSILHPCIASQIDENPDSAEKRKEKKISNTIACAFNYFEWASVFQLSLWRDRTFVLCLVFVTNLDLMSLILQKSQARNNAKTGKIIGLNFSFEDVKLRTEIASCMCDKQFPCFLQVRRRRLVLQENRELLLKLFKIYCSLNGSHYGKVSW